MDTIKRIRDLTDWPIKDIAFPVRNMVAHGKGFGQSETFYLDELKKQIEKIYLWVRELHTCEVRFDNFMPTECERWLLFMYHWSDWLKSYADIM